MCGKAFLVALTLLLLSLLFLPWGTALAVDGNAVPHENPDVAEQRFDEVAILAHCSLLLDNVLARSPYQVQWQRAKMPFANVPQGVKKPLDDFGDASVRISLLIVDIESGLDNVNRLAGQFRLQEAETQRQQARDNLTLAYQELSGIETTAASIGEELGATAPAARRPLMLAYEEFKARVDKLRALLDLFQKMLEALPEATLRQLLEALPEATLRQLLEAQPEATLRQLLEAQPEATLRQLLEALPEATLRQLLEALPEATLRQLLEALPQATIQGLLSLLRPTEITLVVEATTGFVGDWLDFGGNLNSGKEGLADRQVVLLLDGVPFLSLLTDPAGSFQGRLQIPYNYVSRLTLQALYFPQGQDVGVYLASKSLPVNLQVLFYAATLHLEVKGKSYPGLGSSLQGRFDYGAQPAPEARDIEIYLGNELVSQSSASNVFEQEIPLSPGTAVGNYRLQVTAPAQQRYAPVASTTTLDVVKAVPVIEMRVPRIAVMPLALGLRGRVYSEVGPVRDAVLNIGFGSRKAQARTSEDGVFATRLDTGMNLSMIGSEGLSLTVEPVEPWNSPASASWSLVVVNPILTGVVLLALCLAMVASGRWLRVTRWLRLGSKRVGTGLQTPAKEPTRDVERGAGIPSLSGSIGKNLKHIVFELYPWLLKSLQGVVRIVFKVRLIRSSQESETSPLRQPRPPAGDVENGGATAVLPQRESKDLSFLVFELYRRLLRLIQDLTRVALKPHLTLREFGALCAPWLGPAHAYLDRFTRLIERQLYSKHPLQPADLERGRELSRLVEESVKHERT